MEAAYDLDELAVYDLQSFIVPLQRIDEVRVAVDHARGHDTPADRLKKGAPFGDVGASVGGSEEEDPVC